MAFEDVNDYLNTVHHIDKTLVGDPTKIVIKTEYGFTMKEIICNLLAGRGLKIPNIQVCVSINMKAILGVPNLPADLRDALTQLDSQFDEYLEHTSFDNIMGRINKSLNEFSQVANMVNFCATPIVPVKIPNVLENIMDSYLGAGQELIELVGSMLEPGGCLSFDGQEFNTTVFKGGILKQISDKWEWISNGSIPQNEIDALISSIQTVGDQFKSLITDENGIIAIVSSGGSEFSEDTTSSNLSMGVMFDAESAGVQGVTALAASLKASYDQLGGYPVVDKHGRVYKNIFETFLEPGLLELLDKQSDPLPTIDAQEPVYDYCGQVIGFTRSVTQEAQQTSDGNAPTEPVNSPGLNGGGLIDSSPFPTVGTSSPSGGGSTTTIISNTTTGATVEIVSSESAQLNLNVLEDTIVVRVDQTASYVKNSGTSGTINDFTAMNTPLSDFMTHLNAQTGDGIVVKTNGFSRTRSLTATSNETTISNSDGQAGDIIIGLAPNPTLPGSNAVVIPVGTVSQRSGTAIGSFRYNTTSDVYEGYFGGASSGWKQFLASTGNVYDGTNLGSGEGSFFQNNNGILEFKSFAGSGAIQLSSTGDTITITDLLTASNQGSGVGTFKQRNVNDLEFRTLVATDNITVTENTDTITITGDTNLKYGSAATTDATQTGILFDGSQIAPPNDTAWFFTITVIGRRSDSPGVMAMKREGIVDNTAGVITVINDESNSVIYANTVASAWDLAVSDTGNLFNILVTGSAASTIAWTAKINIVAAS